MVFDRLDSVFRRGDTSSVHLVEVLFLTHVDDEVEVTVSNHILLNDVDNITNGLVILCKFFASGNEGLQSQHRSDRLIQDRVHIFDELFALESLGISLHHYLMNFVDHGCITSF